MCSSAIFWMTLTLISVFGRREASYQQYFRTAPRNTRVHEGGEAVLECEVSNLAGRVQWAKDGFALGFSSVIPGHPRYSMVGDRRHGIHNLRIVNASLEDDAEFQCQVGPASNNAAIRANASLTVIAPPTSVEIAGYPSGSKLEIREGAEVALECRVRSAKPAAKIVWYRGSVEFKLDRQKDEVVEIEDPSGNPKKTRYTTKSRIRLKPSSEDDLAQFSCEARHEALSRDMPLRSSLQLSVLYPPGAPYIEGYAAGETVRRGQSLELVCRSRGGNPPAQLIWYKNGEQINMAYRTSGRMSENVLSFTAEASDNKARYRCEAKNIMISNTLKAEVDLTVLFAPAQVTISGPSEARIDDPVALTCTTAPSNPPALIRWHVLDKPYKNQTNRTALSSEGGWVTSSNITFVANRTMEMRSIVVQCVGINDQLTETVVSTHTVNVLYPPSSLMITGYTPGTILAAGAVQKLLCVAIGGNPLATITWFKNDKEIHSTTKISDKSNSVSAEVSIRTNVTDNRAQYRCEATNSGTDIPLFKTVTLSVHFPPSAVEVRVVPPELRPGDTATLVCDASSSNPPAAMSWWRDGIPVQGGSAASFKEGLHGGTVSSTELKLNVTKEMNGAVYTCQAMNEALQRSVHNAKALKVLYAPVFLETDREVSAAENDTLVVSLRADANPGSVTYTWTKDGHPVPRYTDTEARTVSEGSALNMTRLSREDAGVYMCEAVNSQGAATINITVNVHYAPIIEAVSGLNIVPSGQDALLWCTATGNPLSEEHFSWRREGYSKFDTKTTTTYDAKNGTSYLHVEKADRSDVGKFACVVNNGIGKAVSRDVMLITNFAPETDDTPKTLKFATDKAVTARLICKFSAAPSPTVIWSKSGRVLPVNASSKYTSTQTVSEGIHHTAVLYIANVDSADYGDYECVANNADGEARKSLVLNVTSAPDEPLSLKVTNVTHNTVTLEWVPGFDGGMPAKYKIRYRKIYETVYREEGPIHSPKYVVRNLERSTEYVFSVMAMNERGNSRYRPDDTRTATLTQTELGELHVTATPQDEDRSTKDSQVMLYVSVAAAILLLANVALIGCFLWRRRAKRMKEQAGQSSKSATIEMYAPSSYNDTMTGETLSSVSEKSETYSADEGDERGAPPPIPDVPAMPSRHVFGQTDSYMLDDVLPPAVDCPPPNYATHDAHARTLPHPHTHRHALNTNTMKSGYAPAPSPMPPLDGSYYNMSSERYLSYPPLVGEYMHQGQMAPPPPPQQYSSPPHAHLTPPGGSPAHANSPPPNYMHRHAAIPMDRQSLAGTLRRQRLEKMAAVPPPDVTVLHATCNQPHNRSPPTQTEKQPQSILKDPSRHKYNQYQHGSPMSSSTPISNTSNQILTIQNLTSDIPQYGTIRKDKKNNVTIDESFAKRETHVV